MNELNFPHVNDIKDKKRLKYTDFLLYVKSRIEKEALNNKSVFIPNSKLEEYDIDFYCVFVRKLLEEKGYTVSLDQYTFNWEISGWDD